MKPAPLKTKHIIAEFNREPANSERSKNIDLTSEGGEAIVGHFYQNHPIITKKAKLKRE